MDHINQETHRLKLISLNEVPSTRKVEKLKEYN